HLLCRIYPKYNNFPTNIFFPTNHNTLSFTFLTYLHYSSNHNPTPFTSAYFLNNRVQL
ncbi:Os03g0365250, partial [Oryza sativa Japonica Group]